MYLRKCLRKNIIRIPLLMVLIISLSYISFKIFSQEAQADPSSTSVTIDNEGPSFTVDPAESVASTSTNPTNVGSNVTFQATATDPNSDDWVLLVCNNGSTPVYTGSTPECNGGSGNRWCRSGSSVASGNQNTCDYTTQAGDSESNAWYAFACDDVTGGSCSSADQGTGDSGSPFEVNHAPSFSSASGNSADPGGTITVSSTASDSDTSGSADQVKLVVCADTNGATYSGCSGTQLCVSSDSASDPSCNFSLDAVEQDGSHNLYAYIFDSHEFASASNYITDSYTVNNVSPSVSGVTLNSGSNISLTESTTTNVVITGTVTDNNSCQDLDTVTTSLYRSAVTFASCDDNSEDDDDSCYAVVSCNVVGSGNTCDSDSDASADYTCTVAVQFHADTTAGAGSSDSPWYDQTWLSTIKATDDSASTDDTEVGSGVELNDCLALTVTSSIGYGNMSAGTDSGSSNQTTVVTASGNVPLDTDLSGTAMTQGGCAYDIPVGNQEHSFTTFTYGAGTDLTSTPTEYQLNCVKTYYNGGKIDGTQNIYWGIEIPSTICSGLFEGEDTVTAVKGDVGDWGPGGS